MVTGQRCPATVAHIRCDIEGGKIMNQIQQLARQLADNYRYLYRVTHSGQVIEYLLRVPTPGGRAWEACQDLRRAAVPVE